jgi:hypothetical protein
MVALLVLVAFLIFLGVASALGWTYDSRDPEFGLGLVVKPRESNAPTTVAGTLPGDDRPRSSVDRAVAF